MEGRLVHLNFSDAFDKISHCGLLYKIRSVGVGGQFQFIVSKFLSVRRQRVRLGGKVSVSVVVISVVPQCSVLGALLFILYFSELFHIVGSHILGNANDTIIYADIHRPLLRLKVIETLNQDLVATNSWCLKWHMRLNPKKTKSIVVSRSRITAFGYGDLTFGNAELEEVKRLRILGAILDSNLKLTYETHSREVVSQAVRSGGRALSRKVI